MKISAEEAVKMFTESAKQQFLNMKYKLSSFKCPCCGAPNVMYADSAVLKDASIDADIDEKGYADYVVICPKCRGYIAIRRSRGLEKSSSSFYSPDRYIFMFHTVYNNRVRGIYHSVPPDDVAVFEGSFESSCECHTVISYNGGKAEYETPERMENKKRIFYEIQVPKNKDNPEFTMKKYTSKVFCAN